MGVAEDSVEVGDLRCTSVMVRRVELSCKVKAWRKWVTVLSQVGFYG